jgi:hypothetical protein
MSLSRPIVVCIVCLRPRNRMLSIKFTYWLSL